MNLGFCPAKLEFTPVQIDESRIKTDLETVSAEPRAERSFEGRQQYTAHETGGTRARPLMARDERASKAVKVRRI